MEDQQNTNSKNDFIEETKIENDTELSEEQIIEQLKKELEEKQDLILRTAAEAQNTRKRAEKDIIDAKNYALSSFAKDIVAVCDNLERSLSAAKQQIETTTDKDMCTTLITGVEMTLNMLLKAMEDRNINKIEAAIGQKFDPHLHQAMFEQPAPEGQEAGTIASIVQPGYTINDRILRPAMVGITKKS